VYLTPETGFFDRFLECDPHAGSSCPEDSVLTTYDGHGMESASKAGGIDGAQTAVSKKLSCIRLACFNVTMFSQGGAEWRIRENNAKTKDDLRARRL
jgi:hypothetical protein